MLSCHLESWPSVSVLGEWNNHSVWSQGRQNKTKVLTNSFVSGRLHCLIKYLLTIDHIGMYDFNVNKTSSCSSSEGISSLMYNLRVLFTFVNHLELHKCPGSRAAKFLFKGSSLHCFSNIKNVLLILFKHRYVYQWDLKIIIRKQPASFFTDWPFRSTRSDCLAIQVLKHVAQSITV